MLITLYSIYIILKHKKMKIKIYLTILTIFAIYFAYRIISKGQEIPLDPPIEPPIIVTSPNVSDIASSPKFGYIQKFTDGINTCYVRPAQIFCL